MSQKQVDERDRLIGRFALVARDQGAIIPHNSAFFPREFNDCLMDLVTGFGYDPRAQGFIIHTLDDLLDRKPAAMVREVVRAVIFQATTRKLWHPKDSDKAQGFDELDRRMSLLWKHMLVSDSSTPVAEKVRECFSADMQTASIHLKGQAAEAHQRCDGFKVYAAQPW